MCVLDRAAVSKHAGCVLVRGEVNSRPLWLGSKLSVFGLVVFGSPMAETGHSTVDGNCLTMNP